MSLYTAVATSTGRDGRAFASDGAFDLKLALQKEFGGDGDGTNPEQLFAAGYAACFASSIQLVARRTKTDVTGVRVTAHVDANAAGAGFTLAVAMRVSLPSHLSRETAQGLVEAAHQICPYSNATRGNIPVDLILE